MNNLLINSIEREIKLNQQEKVAVQNAFGFSIKLQKDAARIISEVQY
ncbi:hypothetical protein [Mongoliibacter sp.]|nr:hypothetical protein [Mongoliibacter sp.]